MSQFAINPATEAATRGGSVNRFQDMSSEDFIKIIFTELSNQDPFSPNDSAALLEQMNSIRSIESDISLTSKLESLVVQNQLSTAGNLVGKFVGGLNDTADRVSGIVMGVSKAGDKVNLELDSGWTISMDNIEAILDPSTLNAQSPSSTTTG